MQELNYLLDLESLVTRLIDLPKFLGSDSKKDRKYGREVFNGFIFPAISEITEFGNTYGLFDDNTDPFYQFGKYYALVNNSQYEEAAKRAMVWLSFIRKDIQRKRKWREREMEFQNFYS